jgi:hypothetical protein
MTDNRDDDPFNPFGEDDPQPGTIAYDERWPVVAQGQYNQPPYEGIYAPNAGFYGYPFVGRGSTPLSPGFTPEQEAEITKRLYDRGWAPDNTRFARGLGRMGIVGAAEVFTPVNGASVTQELVRVEREDDEASDMCLNVMLENIDTNALNAPIAQIRCRWGAGGFQNVITFDAVQGTTLNFSAASVYCEAIVPAADSTPNPAIVRIGATLAQGTRSANHNIVSTDYGTTIAAGASDIFTIPTFADAVLVSRAAGPTTSSFDVQMRSNAGENHGIQTFAASVNMENWLPLNRRATQIQIDNTSGGGLALVPVLTFRMAV